MIADELVEEILIQAWMDGNIKNSFKERWYFYRAAQLTSRQWRRISHAVMLQYAMLDSLVDLQAYDHLIRLHVDSVRAKERQDGTGTIHRPTSDSTVQDIVPTKRGKEDWELFNTAIIRIPSSHSVSWCLNEFSDSRWKLLLPSCRRIVLFQSQQCRLSDVSVFATARSIRVVTFAIGSLDLEDVTSPAGQSILFPGVKTVHVYRCPTADTKRISARSNEVKALISFFPDIRHLTLNSPISFVSLAPLLPNIESLTLEIPPLYIQNLRATSVMGWNLSAALQASPVATARSEGEDGSVAQTLFRPKKIIVETEEELPNGWDQLAKRSHRVPRGKTSSGKIFKNPCVTNWELLDTLSAVIPQELETLMEHSRQETKELRKILEELEEEGMESEPELW
ncbi:hypothetical protein EIP91_007317 [Steccherinum ochraceum]|uniref:Uncharacterized protein n=1 Tax=Steccherinum ochraceum TaxID=92696 RepID=A0A4R0RRN7_9APHY|nr:hypothetical protein EIP91_007317 [Steccherinum ochraceum]